MEFIMEIIFESFVEGDLEYKVVEKAANNTNKMEQLRNYYNSAQSGLQAELSRISTIKFAEALKKPNTQGIR
jgi:hypothetical protein